MQMKKKQRNLTSSGKTPADSGKHKADKNGKVVNMGKFRKKRKKKSKDIPSKTDNRKKDLIYALIFLGLLLLISLWRNAVISELEYKNADLNSKMERLENKVSDLSIDIEQTKESDWLKTQAEDRINMRDAQKDEIVTLDLNPKKEENKFVKFFKDLFRSPEQKDKKEK